MVGPNLNDQQTKYSYVKTRPKIISAINAPINFLHFFFARAIAVIIDPTMVSPKITTKTISKPK